MIKRYEFWPARLFEIPYYLWLCMHCLLRGMGIRTLAKANYALNHGEIGLGSKYETHQAFDEKYFLPTDFLSDSLSPADKATAIKTFADQHGYPVLLKSNVGCVGKGIIKLSAHDDIEAALPTLAGDYLLQKFTTFNTEYGVFYTRHKGKVRITGINRKHFPTVRGNGKSSLADLARNHYRYSDHWHAFLQYHDTSRIPAAGEKIQLSFIGSHTLGCKFTDDTHLITPELEAAVADVFASQPGYNFGRIDIKTLSPETFQQGDFVVIEVNGVASLPTHMFDPKYSLAEAYRIFIQHAGLLAKIAHEQRHRPMEFLPVKELIQQIREGNSTLNTAHNNITNRQPAHGD
ncbi:MAG: hypothetical protein V7745_01695 [Pseudomonadales bacterium]